MDIREEVCNVSLCPDISQTILYTNEIRTNLAFSKIQFLLTLQDKLSITSPSAAGPALEVANKIP